MAVTKAQLVVWALIAAVSAGGYFMLSRVKAPEAGAVGAVAVRAMVVASKVAAAAPATAQPVAALPAAIPEFPFPDDLMAATAGETPQPEVPQAVASFAEIPGDAIPQIATIGDGQVATVTAPAVVEPASPAPHLVAEVSEEPPIPMPARPVVAQPVRAVPLSEVKTLYVVADALNVRAAPTTSGPVLQKLPQGFAVAARQQADEWIGFVMRDGSMGWMRTDYLSDTMPALAPPRVAVPAGEPLNLMM